MPPGGGRSLCSVSGGRWGCSRSWDPCGRWSRRWACWSHDVLASDPEAECRYAARYNPDESTTILLRDSDRGACGPVQVGVLSQLRRAAVHDLAFPAGDCPVGCELEPIIARAPALEDVLLKFFGSDQAQVIHAGVPMNPFPLPGGKPSYGDGSLMPVDRGDLVVPEVVVELYQHEGYVLDLDGHVVSTFHPLPGTPFSSVATPGAWYRFHQMNGTAGRIEVLDPVSLRPGRPGPEFPCRNPGDMSTSRGRLLVQCENFDVYVFA